MKTLVKIRHYCHDRMEDEQVEILFFGDETHEDIKDQVHCQFCDSDPMMFIPTGGDTSYPIHQHPTTPIIDVVDIEAVD
jgi:hypothetical protein